MPGEEDVAAFLSAIGLAEHTEALLSLGYDDIEVLGSISPEDLSEASLGVPPGHRKKIVMNAQKLLRGEPLGERGEELSQTVRLATAHMNTGGGTARSATNTMGFTARGGGKNLTARAGPLSQTARRVDSRELQHVRAIVKKRGGDGINGLSRIFRQFDDVDGNKTLSKAEFITGLQNYGVRLSKEQFNSLFGQFDRDGNSVVSVTEFLRTVAGPLNRKRREIVDRAFAKFDRDGSGGVTIEDLVGVYNTDGNPEVQSGRKTSQQVLTDFLNSFQAGADGHITTEDFAEYYANISCGIDSDEAFELLLTNSWSTKTNAKIASYAGAH